MTSLIAWLDASSEDQRRMREIVNLFSQRESRDELGIGQVRDALSDMLWPGTSTLFTRARYFLFIPWCFRAAGEARTDVDRAIAQADQNERRLIGALMNAGESDGVIGVNAGAALKTLPSAMYWSGLGVHGILNDPTLSRADVAAAEVDRAHARRSSVDAADDDATSTWRAGAFHSTLPDAPAGFPVEMPDGFAMPNAEASWLRDRMLASSPDTMLAYALEHRPDRDSDAPWHDSVLAGVEGDLASELNDARRFSAFMNGAALLYNLLLAEAYVKAGFDRLENPVETYRDRLATWGAQPGLAHDLHTWDRDGFWSRVLLRSPRLNQRSRRFIDSWLDLLGSADLAHLAENEELRSFIHAREREHKRSQARLDNVRLLQAWLGSSGSGALIYRWPQVRTVLSDIHDGMERTDA